VHCCDAESRFAWPLPVPYNHLPRMSCLYKKQRDLFLVSALHHFADARANLRPSMAVFSNCGLWTTSGLQRFARWSMMVCRRFKKKKHCKKLY
jgi:hypothetical protein